MLDYIIIIIYGDAPIMSKDDVAPVLYKMGITYCKEICVLAGLLFRNFVSYLITCFILIFS